MPRLRALAIAVALVAGGALAVLSAPATASAACTPSNFPNPTLTDLQSTAGQPGVITMPGLCLSPTATVTLTTQQPAGVGLVVNGDGTATAGFTVTPPGSSPVVTRLEFDLTDGPTTKHYTIRAAFGPNTAVFPDAVPNPIGLEPNGDGTFTIPGLYWPVQSSCEINVGWADPEPPVDNVVDPPNLFGLPISVGVRGDGEPWTGIATLNYRIGCTPPNGPSSSRTYELVLYVGVPLPAPPAPLPATGPSPAPLIAITGAILALGAVLVVSGRRRRHV